MSRPVLYAGDCHGKFDHVIRHALSLDALAVVLLGDLEPQAPLHEVLAPIAEKVWFIHGNHDSESEQCFKHIWDSKLAHRSLHGVVVTLPNGIRIGGLGGVFRSAVWNPSLMGASPKYRNREEHARDTRAQDRWGDGPPMRHLSSIYPDEIDALSLMHADVLVTHAASSYHPHGWDIFDALAQSMGVKVVVHGHEHDCVNSQASWAGQGFKSHGVGLRGLTAIDVEGNAKVIVPGELDAARSHRQDAYDAVNDVPQRT